jgi:hypothetical protein
LSRSPRRDLRDQCGFWLSISVAIVGLGGIAVTVSATATISQKLSPWTSGWFIFGFVDTGLGGLCVLWALILYVAHRHVGDHWCPDPQAHVIAARPPNEATVPVLAGTVIAGSRLPVLDAQWLRSLLREIKFDLLDATDRIQKAQEDSRYWGGATGTLRERAWSKNQRKLSGLPGMGDMYDCLWVAFGHIKRVNRLHMGRTLNGSAVRPVDNLPDAEAAIRKAEAAVEKQLAELG